MPIRDKRWRPGQSSSSDGFDPGIVALGQAIGGKMAPTVEVNPEFQKALAEGNEEVLSKATPYITKRNFFSRNAPSPGDEANMEWLKSRYESKQALNNLIEAENRRFENAVRLQELEYKHKKSMSEAQNEADFKKMEEQYKRDIKKAQELAEMQRKRDEENFNDSVIRLGTVAYSKATGIPIDTLQNNIEEFRRDVWSSGLEALVNYGNNVLNTGLAFAKQNMQAGDLANQQSAVALGRQAAEALKSGGAPNVTQIPGGGSLMTFPYSNRQIFNDDPMKTAEATRAAINENRVYTVSPGSPSTIGFDPQGRPTIVPGTPPKVSLFSFNVNDLGQGTSPNSNLNNFNQQSKPKPKPESKEDEEEEDEGKKSKKRGNPIIFSKGQEIPIQNFQSQRGVTAPTWFWSLK